MEIEYSSSTYITFFSLSHLTTWVILIGYGLRQRYPMVKWLMIIMTGYMCFTIGTHISLASLFHSGGSMESSTNAKSLVGGFLLSVPAMLFMKSALRFRLSVFEPYALAIPLGIAIQRIGCLFAGCCYGIPSQVSWAVTYPYGHPLHFNMWQDGSLAPGAWHVNLHPVQWYESLLCFAVFVFILILYTKGRMKNKLIFLSLPMCFAIRFMIEFVRDKSAHAFEITYFIGLNTVQWTMIFLIFLMLAILVSQGKVSDTQKGDRDHQPFPPLRLYVWYLILLMIMMGSQQLVTHLEYQLLQILFVPLSIGLFLLFFHSFSTPKLTYLMMPLIVLGVFMMGQDTPKIVENEYPRRFHEISVGGIMGSYQTDEYATDCDGNQLEHLYRFSDQYHLFGVGYKQVWEYSESQRFTFITDASYGKISEDVEDYQSTTSSQFYTGAHYENQIWIVSPFIQYDFSGIALGAGLNLGDVSVLQPNEYHYDVSKSYKRYALIPRGYVRVNFNQWWMEGNVGNTFPGFAPTNTLELFVGIEGAQGNTTRIGTSTLHGLIIRPSFRVKDHMRLEPILALFGPVLNDASFSQMGLQFGVNMSYRINR